MSLQWFKTITNASRSFSYRNPCYKCIIEITRDSLVFFVDISFLNYEIRAYL